MPLSKTLFFFSFLLLNFPATIPTKPIVGINYATLANNLPRPESAMSTLQSLKTTHIRLPETNPGLTRAFSFSPFSLLLTIPNPFIPQIASNQSHALRWLSSNVSPFFPRAKISMISVGNEVLSVSPELAEFLLPAIQNVHLALHELGLIHIRVSTSHSFQLIDTPFPPSSAEFQESVSESYIKPILEFLESTNSSFLIGINPFYLCKSDPELTAGYCLFQNQESFNYRDDPVTGLRYRNLFDEMVDAVFTALTVLGHGNVSVVVSETGWPSSGEWDEQEASLRFAELYNTGLTRHLASELGTPMRRDGLREVYIYSLFDENMRPGFGSEKHWGILYANSSKKYELDLSGSS